MISSSLVGITQADTRLPDREIRGPRARFASGSMSMPSQADARSFGTVFDEVAEDYDRHRPSYPDVLVDEACEAAGIGPGARDATWCMVLKAWVIPAPPDSKKRVAASKSAVEWESITRTRGSPVRRRSRSSGTVGYILMFERHELAFAADVHPAQPKFALRRETSSSMPGTGAVLRTERCGQTPGRS